MADPTLLVLDLDGTTLTHEGAVIDADARAAKALAERGIQVTIATGRLFPGTQPAARTLGVSGSVAVMNGTELVDAASGAVTYGQYVHGDHRVALRHLLNQFGIAPILFGPSRIQHDAQGAHLNRYLSTWSPDVLHHDELPDHAWDQDRLLAVAGTGEHGAIQAAAEQIALDFPQLRPTRFTTWEGHGFLELRAQGDDKGTALHRLAAERGFTVEQTVAVGDWINDIGMLREAGLSFAMNGSASEATDTADHTLDATRGEGGAVAEVARRVWGIEL